MKSLILSGLLILSAYARAQNSPESTDSVIVIQKEVYKNELKEGLFKSLPIIAVGTIGTFTNKLINRYEFKEERDNKFQNFHTHVDNYLQYAPAALMYGMNILGFKGKHNIQKQSLLLLKSEMLTEAIVYPLKKFTRVMRPDGSASNSFPSGHTAQAFAEAEVLRMEYGKSHPWISIGGYIAASVVGATRVLNNRHWVTDVIAGAGIGMLSTDIIYWMDNRKQSKKNNRIVFLPMVGLHGAAIYTSYNLGKVHI
ncbi:MAG: phosphatase PAP2 family protein [Ferruginibacter sp.]